MKRAFVLFCLMVISFMLVSCNFDDEKDTGVVHESEYTFSYSFSVMDIGQNYCLLSEKASDSTFSKENIMLKAISDDEVTFDIVQEQYRERMDVQVSTCASNGINIHEMVFEWNKNDLIIRDTVKCEIEKQGDVVSCKKIWINKELEWDNETSLSPEPSFLLMKILPKYIPLRDKNNNSTRVEKEVDGLNFIFWLSDMDGNETAVFDEKDIRKRGFNFNMSITNHTDQTISIDNFDIAPFLSNVFNPENCFVGRSCAQFQEILAIYHIKPGETHTESLYWCRCDEDFSNNKPLPPGKYYTCFYRTLSNLNDKMEKVEIPPMYINFEVK